MCRIDVIYVVRSHSGITDLFLLFLLGDRGSFNRTAFFFFLLERLFSLVEKKIGLLVHNRFWRTL